MIDLCVFHCRNIMNNISLVLEKMGNSSTATITMGPIKGAIIKLSFHDQTGIKFGIKTSGNISVSCLS